MISLQVLYGSKSSAMSTPTISTPALSNNVNKKFNKIRVLYAKSSQRPFKIKNHPNNYVLIGEELDVVWPKMAQHLGEFIKNLEYGKVEIMLKSRRIIELTIDVQLYTSPELVARMKRLGVKINFDRYILSLKPLNTNLIELCENVRSNLAQYNLPIPGIALDGNRLLIEFFKLTKTPYYTIYNWHCSPSMSLNDVFEVKPRYRDALMERCLISYHGFIEPLLSTGYIPSIEVLMNCSRCYTIGTVVHILECSQLTDDYKIKYLIRILKDRSNYQFDALYYNATSVKYLKMLKVDDIQHDTIREFIINGTIPEIEYDIDYEPSIIDYLNYYDVKKLSLVEEVDIDPIIEACCEDSALHFLNNVDRDRLYSSLVNKDTSLMKCTDSGLKEYWSRIPTNNESFLQFLDYRRSQGDEGIELPPAIGDDYSLTRLSRSSELKTEVRRLLSKASEYEVVLLIVQLMNRGLVNLRPYLEYGFDIVDQLIQYQVIRTTKNTRTILR